MAPPERAAPRPAPRPAAVPAELLSRHGRTCADDIGADVAGGGAPAMFRLLVFALLASTRIRAAVAAGACRALLDAGWTTPATMVGATWAERTRVLKGAGYARYDESTSRRRGALSRHLQASHGGDVRRIRDAAGRGPGGRAAPALRVRRDRPGRCGHLPPRGPGGMGGAGAVRGRAARQTAAALGLPPDAGELARMVRRDDLPRLVAALVRTRLGHGVDAVRAVAACRWGSLTARDGR